MMEQLLSIALLIVFGVPLLMVGGTVLGLTVIDAALNPVRSLKMLQPHFYIVLGTALLLGVGWLIAAVQGRSQEYGDSIVLAFRALAYVLTGKVF